MWLVYECVIKLGEYQEGKRVCSSFLHRTFSLYSRPITGRPLGFCMTDNFFNFLNVFSGCAGSLLLCMGLSLTATAGLFLLVATCGLLIMVVSAVVRQLNYFTA